MQTFEVHNNEINERKTNTTPDENISSKAKQGKQVPEGTDVAQDQVYDAKTGAQPPEESEAAGHTSPGAYYTCFSGDWTGWIPAGWTYFICPYGHLN